MLLAFQQDVCDHIDPDVLVVYDSQVLCEIVSRFELYNRSLTFEADDISKEQPAEAERLATILEKWAATLDPIPPNTMSSNSKHMGCLAYGYPTAAAEVASAHSGMAAALGIVAEEGDTIDAMYRI